MFRRPAVRWPLLALFLVLVGLWPSAAAPVALASAGADHVLGAIPGPVLLAAAGIAWLKHRPTPATA